MILFAHPVFPTFHFWISFQGKNHKNLKVIFDYLFQIKQFFHLVSVNTEDIEVYFQLRSNLIGIFKVNCVWNQDDPYHETEEMVTILEVVVGRVKVAENLLTTLMMSVGLGLALFIMGMEIDIQQVILVVK